MSGVVQGLIASLVSAAGAVTDTFFRYVSLLLNTTTTNGAQNNTFLDGSTNNFSITRNGNTTQGTFSPFSQTGWSNYFDGTGDYLTLASNAAFGLGTGDFTIEMWVYATANPANGPGTIFDSRTGVTSTATACRVNSSLNVLFYDGPSNIEINVGTIQLNTWTHIAHVRASGSLKTYINGSLSNTTTVTSDLGTNQPCMIGNNQTAGFAWNGYQSNFRIVKGTAVYTANFTPPTSPLTAISGTSLLTCQSNRFIDNSSNAFTITRNGDVSVQAFSPFNPTAAWSASTNGGSGYFDGTGDSLVTPAGLNTAIGGLAGSTWTIESWVYVPSISAANSGYTSVISCYQAVAANGRWWFGYAGTTSFKVRFTYTISTASELFVETTNSFALNAWHHIAVTIDATTSSSSTINLFVDGVLQNTFASQNLSTQGTNYEAPSIGGNATTFVNNATGYITNVRMVKGALVYTGNYTVPTAPLSAISGTLLLCNFTNAGIYDSASGNDLETVGNAQVSTVQAKWGTTSMAFDGTDDRLVFPSSQQLAMGTGDFTIEGWVRRSDTNVRGIFQLCGTAGGLSGAANLGLAIGSDTGQVWRIYANNAGYNSTATWAINTWYHFALVKTAGNIKLYVDGTSVITQADTTNYTGTFLCVGGFYDTTFLMNGYIDDLRFTKGYARYTANFTPPTAAFPLQ